MPKKKASLINAFKDIGKESGEITYAKTLKDAEDWLAKITVEQLISTALDPLKLTNPDLVKQWVDEFSRAEHQQLSSSIEKLKTPLVQMIETQRMELNATNQKEIEHLQSEIKDYQTKLELCTKTLDNIETLKQQQQQEKENLQKNYQKPSQSTQEAIEKANAPAVSLNLTPIPFSPTSPPSSPAGAPPNTPPPLSSKRILESLKRRVASAKTTEDIKNIPAHTLNVVKEIDEYIWLSVVDSINTLKKGIDGNTKNAVILSLNAALEELTPEKSQLLSSRPDLAKNTRATTTQETIEKANTPAVSLTVVTLAVARLSKESEEKLASPNHLALTEFIPSKNEFTSLPNGKILTGLKKQIQDAKTTTDIEKIPDSILNLVKEIDESAGSHLENLITSLKNEPFNKNANTEAFVVVNQILVGQKSASKLNSHSDLAKDAASELNHASALTESLKTLNQMVSEQREEATKAMETLNTQHEASVKVEYQKLYAGIPEEKWPETPQTYLATLKREQQLKELQFGLAKVKTALNENHVALKQVNKSVEERPVPNVVFNQPGVLTPEQWANHYQACTKQLGVAQAKYLGDKNTLSRAQATFKQLTQQTQALDEQIASLAQKASPEVSIQINALSSLKENIKKQGEILAKEYTEVQNKLKGKTENLQKARKLLIEENEQADLFNQQLIAVPHIQTRADLRLKQVQARSHPLVNDILDGTQKNPSCILVEDQFYENTNQSIANLKAQLDELEKNKIQKEAPLSALESAFNQALATKITAARTAIATLQTSYQTKKQEWEAYSTEDLLLQHSRQITNAPNKISDTLTDCQGWSLERIQLADKDFRGVAMRYAYLNHAELRRCNFSGMALEGINFGRADIQTCQFENANFKRVILHEQTQFNWGAYGQKVLLDNLSDLYSLPSEIYLQRLVKLVAENSPKTITGDLILKLLMHTEQIERPDNVTEKAHLIAQQNHAVSIVNYLVPCLTSVEEVLKFSTLIEEKRKDEEKNPYAFIRRELDLFRLKYGNTHAWEQIMTCIQKQLQQLTKDVQPLKKEQYEAGEMIMKAHVKHDYGFGFFYTPGIAHQWEKEHKSNTLKPK